MQKQLEKLSKETVDAIVRHHGKRAVKDYGVSKPITRTNIDSGELLDLELTGLADLGYLLGKLDAYAEVEHLKKSITIDFTESDLHDLMHGETFDWTYDGIDVHLFNSDVVGTSKARSANA